MSKAISIPREKNLVTSKTRLKTDVLQSAYEETLEREEQQASMKEWSEYRLDFSGVRYEVTGQVHLRNSRQPKSTRTFVCLASNSLSLTPMASGATKLAYLRGSLTDAALDTIEGLSASNQSYELALRRLRERFDRPMVAVREQILRLVNLFMNKNKLSTICDEFHKKVYALTAFGKEPRTSDLWIAEVLIALCREQLPGAVLFRWDELVQANNVMVADLPAFLLFLQQQTDLFKALRKSEEPTHEGSETQTTYATAVPEFASRESPSEPETARRARLCFACLQPGHYALQCKREGKRADRASVTASTPSPSASLSSVAKQKTTIFSEGPSLTPRSLPGTIRAVAYGEEGPGKLVTCLLDTASEQSFTFICFAVISVILGCEPTIEITCAHWARQRKNALTQIRGGPEDPVAVESVLGWIICDPVIVNHTSSVTTTLCAPVDQSIDRTLRRFWEIEKVGVGSKDESEMPMREDRSKSENVDELEQERCATAVVTMTAASLDATFIFGPESFSDLERPILVTAWCQCLIHNARELYDGQ
ncbi:hypothetical protein T11_2476, partial [Trichinella zimbabwensis]